MRIISTRAGGGDVVVHLINASGDLADTLPALRVRMCGLAEGIAQQMRAYVGPASWPPDPVFEAAFGPLSQLSIPAADRLGFSNDRELSALVADRLET